MTDGKYILEKILESKLPKLAGEIAKGTYQSCVLYIRNDPGSLYVMVDLTRRRMLTEESALNHANEMAQELTGLVRYDIYGFKEYRC